MSRVSVIVPAYNEAPRIGDVLQVLVSWGRAHEVIVVDDGSSDGTGEVARGCEVRVVRHERNRGKGEALTSGVAVSCGDVLLFCDADLLNLSHTLLDALVEPVVEGTYDMYVLARTGKTRRLPFGYTYTPLLDGQRALTRVFWNSVPCHLVRGFATEVVLNWCARRVSRCGFFEDASIAHVRKEEKRGRLRGTLARLSMYGALIDAHVRVRVYGAAREAYTTVYTPQHS